MLRQGWSASFKRGLSHRGRTCCGGEPHLLTSTGPQRIQPRSRNFETRHTLSTTSTLRKPFTGQAYNLVPHRVSGHTIGGFSSQLSFSSRRNMASLADEKHEWSAKRVRDTYLDYFKKNGHTFGVTASLDQKSSITVLTTSSTIIFRRAARRSHPSLHQCWHEPVQVHFPRHSRSSIRLCSIEACCQFPKSRLILVHVLAFD